MSELKFAESWYRPKLGLAEGQLDYCEMLQDVFNVRDTRMQPIPYKMTKYQTEFHSNSINVMNKEAKDVLFVKARGISFTTSSAIEAVMVGLTFPNQVIPIVSQRWENAVDIVRLCRWLIENANTNLSSEIDINLSQEIRFRNGSIIRPFPSGNASNSIRGYRLLFAILDEFAYQQNAKELLTAVQDAMVGEMGQLIIGSTICGRNNYFYKLIENPTGFKVFNLPIFDPVKFDKEKSVLEQNLIPIAPWIDLEKLEVKRKRDIEIFMQEQMCDPLDDTSSYLPFNLINKCINDKLFNHYYKLKDDARSKYGEKGLFRIGIDPAFNKDLTAFTVFQVLNKEFELEDGSVELRECYVQRYLDVVKNMEAPEQNAYLDKILDYFNPFNCKVRIDMTGLGTGMFQYAKKKYPDKVEGIHFASSVSSGQQGYKLPIKEKMFTNMKTMMQDESIELLYDELQTQHLSSIDYDFNAMRRGNLGHGDIAYAVGLALLPDNYKISQLHTGEIRVVGKYRNEKVPDEVKKINPYAETLMQKIRRYRKY